MAVQAQQLAHAFRHDPCAIIRPVRDEATGASSVFLGDPVAGGGHRLAQQHSRGNAVFPNPRSELTWKNNNGSGCCFVPRKRARVGADDVSACSLIMEGHGGALLPPFPAPQPFTAAAGDVESREHGSGAASTSGRPAARAASMVSQRLGVEIDALVRVENERLLVGLQEARRRHLRAVASAMERAAARRLRAAETDLARALVGCADLEERIRRIAAEGQAWQRVANGHEATAAGLRATIDQLLHPLSRTEVEAAVAEDAQSCCFEQDRGGNDRDGTRACRACGAADACVLLLPCRHLCLCGGCAAAVDACPLCAATKNALLHVLLK